MVRSIEERGVIVSVPHTHIAKGSMLDAHNTDDRQYRVKPEKEEEDVTIKEMDNALQVAIKAAYRARFNVLIIPADLMQKYRTYCSNNRLPYHTSNVPMFIKSLK
jgi:hypothetical protein